jgi:branched-chain amino acid transport system permease protein
LHLSLGLIIGIPSIRLKRDYLALATFGFGVIVYSVSKNWVKLTRGPMGLPCLPKFSLFNFEFQPVWAYLIFVAFFVALTGFAINRIGPSPFGRILRSICDDEIASLSIGTNVNKYKLIVFVIGAFFAGIAGIYTPTI